MSERERERERQLQVTTLSEPGQQRTRGTKNILKNKET